MRSGVCIKAFLRGVGFPDLIVEGVATEIGHDVFDRIESTPPCPCAPSVDFLPRVRHWPLGLSPPSDLLTVSGATSLAERCHPSPSTIIRAIAPAVTHLPISARCLFLVFNVDDRHQSTAHATGRADGAEQINPVEAPVPEHPRAGSRAWPRCGSPCLVAPSLLPLATRLRLA
jgi:hypothetical protein